ncbi:MAG: hypothetical protein EHM48_10420 [Planctomycetaceae bacterium]|nr:MAG: hypothetical protein EHM48_10420 [Planctomycetaceae bacterium]
MHKLKENIKPSYGAFSSELGAASGDSVNPATFVNMATYGHARIIGQVVGCTSDNVVSLIALEATAANGGGSATLGAAYTDTFTSTHATHTGVLQVEVDSKDLTTGYQYVGFRLITNDAGGNECVGVVIEQSDPRYAQETLA